MLRLSIVFMSAIALASVPSNAQGWIKTDKVDAFSGNHFVQYTLIGKFLTAPRTSSLTGPGFVLQCVPGERRYAGKWYRHGGFIKGYFDTGSILNGATNGVPVAYRLDDGKTHSANWGGSTDLTSIFPSDIELNTVLFNHAMMHKEATTPPIRKLVLMVDEYLGTGIVMEFDLSGSEDVADACGLTIHSK